MQKVVDMWKRALHGRDSVPTGLNGVMDCHRTASQSFLFSIFYFPLQSQPDFNCHLLYGHWQAHARRAF